MANPAPAEAVDDAGARMARKPNERQQVPPPPHWSTVLYAGGSGLNRPVGEKTLSVLNVAPSRAARKRRRLTVNRRQRPDLPGTDAVSEAPAVIDLTDRRAPTPFTGDPTGGMSEDPALPGFATRDLPVDPGFGPSEEPSVPDGRPASGFGWPGHPAPIEQSTSTPKETDSK